MATTLESLQSENASLKNVIRRMEMEMENRVAQLEIRYRRDALEPYFDKESESFVYYLEDEVERVRKEKEEEITRLKNNQKAAVSVLSKQMEEQLARVHSNVTLLTTEMQKMMLGNTEPSAEKVPAEGKGTASRRQSTAGFALDDGAKERPLSSTVSSLPRRSSLIGDDKPKERLSTPANTSLDPTTLKAPEIVLPTTAPPPPPPPPRQPPPPPLPTQSSWEQFRTTLLAQEKEIQKLQTDLKVHTKGKVPQATDVSSRKALEMEAHCQIVENRIAQFIAIALALDKEIDLRLQVLKIPICSRCGYEATSQEVAKALGVSIPTIPIDKVTPNPRESRVDVDLTLPIPDTVVAVGGPAGVPLTEDFDYALFTSEKRAFMQCVNKELRAPEVLEDILNQVDKGTNLTIVNEKGAVTPGFAFTESNRTLLRITERADRKKVLLSVVLKDIKDVVLGQSNAFFKSFVKESPIPADLRKDLPDVAVVTASNMNDFYHRTATLRWKKAGSKDVILISTSAKEWEAWLLLFTHACRLEVSYPVPDIWSVPRIDGLSPEDQAFCQTHHISPFVFLFTKKQIFEQKNILFTTVLDVRAISGWDFVTSGHVLDYFTRRKWIFQCTVNVVKN